MPPTDPTRTFPPFDLPTAAGDDPRSSVNGDSAALAPTIGGADTLPGEEPPLAACGRFAVTGELGRGGMGVVYRAFDPALSREVAVKVLRERFAHNRSAVRRFLDEATVTSQLQHPSIPPVHEIGELPDGRPFLVMKRIGGRNLADLLAERSSPKHDLPRFLGAFERVCEAVGYAHARRVLHRDLKPANVMVGEFGEVQVMDWGVAKRLPTADLGLMNENSPAAAVPSSNPNSEIGNPQSELTQTGTILGTPAFLAPEQARCDPVDERTDVFGLGGILCNVLTGLPPYSGADGKSTLRMAIRGDTAGGLERLDGCGADPDLIALCKRCLAKDPADRPADAGAVAAELVRVRVAAEQRAKELEMQRAADLAERAERRKRRRTQAGLLAAVAVIGGLVGFGWWHQHEQREAREAARLQRQRDTERDVTAAVAEVDRRLELPAGAGGDPVRWEAAVTAAAEAAKQADGLLAAGEPTPVLRQLTADARRRVAQADRDRRLVVQLDEIAFRYLDTGNLRAAAAAKLSDEYAATFKSYGCDPDGSPDEFAAALSRHPVPEAVLEGLFEWAGHCRRERCPREGFVAAVIERSLPRDPFLTRWWAAARGPAPGPKLAALLPQCPPDKTSPWVAHRLFCDLCDHGRRPDAVALMREAFRRHPADYRLHARFALSLIGDRDPRAKEEAVRHALACVALRQSSVTACVLLGETLSRDPAQQEAAVPWLHRAVALDPDLLYPRLRLAWALLGRRQYPDGLAAAKAALDRHPDHPEALNIYSVAAGSNLRFDEAVTHLERAVELAPNEAALHYNLAGWLLATGRWANLGRAAEHFLTAEKLDPRYARAPRDRPTK